MNRKGYRQSFRYWYSNLCYTLFISTNLKFCILFFIFKFFFHILFRVFWLFFFHYQIYFTPFSFFWFTQYLFHLIFILTKKQKQKKIHKIKNNRKRLPKILAGNCLKKHSLLFSIKFIIFNLFITQIITTKNCSNKPTDFITKCL